MYWMLLEDKQTKCKYFWSSEVGLICVDKESVEHSLGQSIAYNAVNSLFRAGYHQGVRTVGFGGKSFEVLASGRV